MSVAGFVAGETSADRLGAELLLQLRAHRPGLKALGIGGRQMQELGLDSLYNPDRLAVMGLTEPLLRLPELLRLRRQLGDRLLRQNLDVFVGVDAPDFNLSLEKRLKAAGVPTVHYVSPSVWAWRRSRLKTIAKAVDVMLCLFPFELEAYRQLSLRAVCVGHPLARLCPQKPPPGARSEARAALAVEQDATVIALMPGSRRSEVSYNLPVMLQAVQLLASRPSASRPSASRRIVIGAASPARRQQIEGYLRSAGTDCLLCDDSHRLLSAADAALVVMGTATLEAMLHRVPLVSMYRTGTVNYHLMAGLLTYVDMYSLPNLIAGERLIAEVLQREATPQRLAAEVSRLLEEDQAPLLARFDDLHRRLLGEGMERGTELICDLAGWRQ